MGVLPRSSQQFFSNIFLTADAHERHVRSAFQSYGSSLKEHPDLLSIFLNANHGAIIGF